MITWMMGTPFLILSVFLYVYTMKSVRREAESYGRTIYHGVLEKNYDLPDHTVSRRN